MKQKQVQYMNPKSLPLQISFNRCWRLEKYIPLINGEMPKHLHTIVALHVIILFHEGYKNLYNVGAVEYDWCSICNV